MKYIAIVLVFVGIGFASVPPLANAQQIDTMTNQELTALVFSLQARIETLESMLDIQPQAPTQATTTVQNITPPRINTPSTFDVARCRGSIRCAKP